MKKESRNNLTVLSRALNYLTTEQPHAFFFHPTNLPYNLVTKVIGNELR